MNLNFAIWLFSTFWRASRNKALSCRLTARGWVRSSPHKHCLNCQNRARTGPALGRCYPQPPRTGPILALTAVFTGPWFNDRRPHGSSGTERSVRLTKNGSFGTPVIFFTEYLIHSAWRLNTTMIKCNIRIELYVRFAPKLFAILGNNYITNIKRGAAIRVLLQWLTNYQCLLSCNGFVEDEMFVDLTQKGAERSGIGPFPTLGPIQLSRGDQVERIGEHVCISFHVSEQLH